MTYQNRLVQTIALPYCNAELHLGHIVEAALADYHARYRRLRGDDVVFLCADDCHGTPIEIQAANLGIPPETLINDVGRSHREDYAAYDISFSHYHKTHSSENEELAQVFYKRALEKGHIIRRDVAQPFDEIEGRFLSDRNIFGTCPSCAAEEQYGDGCEKCGKKYEAIDLISPLSKFSGTPPTIKTSDHLFFKIEDFRVAIEDWLAGGAVHDTVRAKLQEWLDEPLRDWDISRDAPYFGIPIPGEDNKYFYVWLDAPICYISTLDSYLKTINSDRHWSDDWGAESKTELLHFIGKDIVSFHAIFWPALLIAADCRMPTNIHVHGFLTVNNAKMSKSRGTFLKAKDLVKHLDPDIFRYSVLSRLKDTVDDIDFDLNQLSTKVNSDLVGKVCNIAVRLRPLLDKASSGALAAQFHDIHLRARLEQASGEILEYYNKIQPANAIRRILEIAQETNRMIDRNAPWKETDMVKVQAIATDALMSFRHIMTLLQPITPRLAQRGLKVFGKSQVTWEELREYPFSTQVNIPTRLMDRIADEDLSKIITPAEQKDVK